MISKPIKICFVVLGGTFLGGPFFDGSFLEGAFLEGDFSEDVFSDGASFSCAAVSVCFDSGAGTDAAL
ncbi:MAG: hypothetical protein IJL52_08910 [Clostridia bacterium]|nr:hypothetical protein [Clostridia bacterium]